MTPSLRDIPEGPLSFEIRRPAFPDDAQHTPPPLPLRAVSALTRKLPAVRGSGAIAIRMEPLFRGHGLVLMPVWPSVRMWLDPGDAVGGLLAFVPHLYDRWEREAIAAVLRHGDTFVDIGSNVGAYALWAATLTGPAGRVLAVEADDRNAAILASNIAINGFEDRVTALCCGIADKPQILQFYRNTSGNCGAHSFLMRGEPARKVECLPLLDVLGIAAISRIRVLKLDIEGFELRALEPFFRSAPSQSWPDYLLIEIEGGPATTEQKTRLRTLLADRGYAVLREKANALYKRTGVLE